MGRNGSTAWRAIILIAITQRKMYTGHSFSQQIRLTILNGGWNEGGDSG